MKSEERSPFINVKAVTVIMAAGLLCLAPESRAQAQPCQPLSFQPPRNFDTPFSTPIDVATGDFDNDGDIDMAVSNFESSVSLLLGDGTGNFTAGQSFEVPFWPVRLAAADFNGDHNVDIATVNAAPSDTVTILLGDGTGNSFSRTDWFVGYGPGEFKIVDLNHDGHLDIAVPVYWSNLVSVLSGDGNGGFAAVRQFPSTRPDPGDVITLDFNGDGNLDLLIISAGTGEVELFPGDGTGDFGPSSITGIPPYSGLVTGDFNGDTRTDLVVVNNGVISLYPGTVSGLGAAVVSTSPSDGVNGGFDVNGDGKLDLIADVGNDGVAVLLGDGNGMFGNAGLWYFDILAGSGTNGADLNGDGFADLFTATNSFFHINKVNVLLSMGGCLPQEVLSSLGQSNLWIGLKNSDDQGTRFDLRVEVYRNDSIVGTGVTRCIAGVTRNPSNALDSMVSFDPISPTSYAAGDTLSFRVLARIGTNPDNTKCPGHNSATGLVLYFDGAQRPSRFEAQFGDTSSNLYLHTSGASDVLDDVPPASATAASKSSGPIKFNGGNVWREVGVWTMGVP